MCTGKSTLAKEFEKHSAHFIDLDFLGRQVVSSLNLFNSSDELLRYMSESRENLLEINHRVHPKVYELLNKTIDASSCYVVEYSAYSGEFSRKDDIFLCDAHCVIATNVPYTTRLNWAHKRGISTEKFDTILTLQPSQETFEAVADHVFYNGEMSKEVRDERISRLWTACCK